MAQIYVLDTSVLIHDPHSIKNFDNHQVILPITVLSELDSLKVGTTQASHSAREAARIIDSVREAGNDLRQFSKIPGTDVEMKVLGYDAANTYLPPEYDIGVKDNQIISTACRATYLHKDIDVVLVSKDTVMRLAAESIGLKAENYKKDKVNNSYIFKDSSVKVELTAEEYAKLIETGEVPCAALAEVKDHSLVSCDMHKSRSAILVKTSLQLGEERTHFVKVITNKMLKPWDIRAKNTEQLYGLYLLNEPSIKLVTMMGLAGSGKAQPMTELIPTPGGWKKMGDLHVGDLIFSSDGAPTNVTGVFKRGVKEVFAVTFSDGSSTRCCAEHLWVTINTKEKAKKVPTWSTKTTLEIRDTLRYGKSQRLNHQIPMSKPIDYPQKNLPIDPYLLGVLLGDGGISQSSVYVTTTDFGILLRVAKSLKKIGCRLITTSQRITYRIVLSSDGRKSKKSWHQYTRTSPTGDTKVYKGISDIFEDGYTAQVYRACNSGRMYQGFFWKKDRTEKISPNPLKQKLIELNLMGKFSYNKSIPGDYLVSSIADRIALLQGLMDTDGTVEKNGTLSYSTSSIELKTGITELVQSLGGTCYTTTKVPTYTYNGIKKTGRLSYRCWIVLPNEITPFYLKRKVARMVPRVKYPVARYVTSVESIGSEECQCISVDHPSRTYLTSQYIVTHNTLMSLASGLAQTCDDGRYKKILILRPTVSAGEEIGFLPGSIEEKLAPWMKPVHDAVEFILKDKSSDDDTSKSDYLFSNGTIEVDAISFIRGRSIDNAFIYIDECQNLTPTILKLLISRAGSKSKVIVAGDIDQIDAAYLDKYSTGLAVVAERFRDQPIAGHVILTKSERSKLAQLAAELL